jgi:hypothetical protein
LQKKNSLDERYKDHPNNNAPIKKKEVKTLWYLENLRQKAKPYANFKENLEKVKKINATIQRKYYANAYDYLLEH